MEKDNLYKCKKCGSTEFEREEHIVVIVKYKYINNFLTRIGQEITHNYSVPSESTFKCIHCGTELDENI